METARSLAVCLATAIVLSGCAKGSAADLTIQSFVFSASDVELGDSVTATLIVANKASSSVFAQLGLTVDGQTVESHPISVPGQGTLQRSFTYRPFEGGTLNVQPTINGQPQALALLKVRAPAIAEVRLVPDDPWCKDEVPVHIYFKNAGDGTAKSVQVSATIYNMNNVAQDSEEAEAGDVAPQATGTVDFSLFAPDTCGRDDYYWVEFTIAPRFGRSATFKTEPFSI